MRECEKSIESALREVEAACAAVCRRLDAREAEALGGNCAALKALGTRLNRIAQLPALREEPQRGTAMPWTVLIRVCDGLWRILESGIRTLLLLLSWLPGILRGVARLAGGAGEALLGMLHLKEVATRRRAVRWARHVVKQARHFLAWHEDVLPAADGERLRAGMEALKVAARRRDLPAIENEGQTLQHIVGDLMPQRRWPAWIEDLIAWRPLDRQLAAVRLAARQTQEALMQRQPAGIRWAVLRLERCLDELASAAGRRGERGVPVTDVWREWTEVVVVAIAVAMGFRTYFLQPFKIPTGSMQPTLYGINVRSVEGPSWLDRMPLKLGKWFVTGDWYLEVTARSDGVFNLANETLARPVRSLRSDAAVALGYVGSDRYEIPWYPGLRHRLLDSGTLVQKGDVLWSGIRTAGDHVLVDKMRWNFTRPRRGNIIVFTTKDVVGLPQGTFYIKRLCGLPGETVRIERPLILINGQELKEPASIRRIEDRAPGYEAGYHLPPASSYQVDAEGTRLVQAYLSSATPERTLADGEYLALGDNTANSKDSRYWGPAPQANMVGPALALYWPFYNAAGGPQRCGLLR